MNVRIDNDMIKKMKLARNNEPSAYVKYSIS